MSTRQARRRQQRVRQRGKPSRAATPWYLEGRALAGVAAAIVIVIVLIVVLGQSSKPAAFVLKPVPSQLLKEVTTSPPGVVQAIGNGSLPNPWKAVKGPFLGANGKPELLFIGAEYCPYCAGERWGLINALSRFGTFTGLRLMKSTSGDVYPSTNTFTFRTASYSSPYIVFKTKEVADGAGNKLQTTTPSEQTIWSHYDPGQNFPFLDLANAATDGGVGTAVALLRSGASANGSPLSWQTIGSELSDPTSQAAQLVIGDANWTTAGICKLTKNKPASACANSTIRGLENQLTFK